MKTLGAEGERHVWEINWSNYTKKWWWLWWKFYTQSVIRICDVVNWTKDFFYFFIFYMGYSLEVLMVEPTTTNSYMISVEVWWWLLNKKLHAWNWLFIWKLDLNRSIKCHVLIYILTSHNSIFSHFICIEIYK